MFGAVEVKFAGGTCGVAAVLLSLDDASPAPSRLAERQIPHFLRSTTRTSASYMKMRHSMTQMSSLQDAHRSPIFRSGRATNLARPEVVSTGILGSDDPPELELEPHVACLSSLAQPHGLQWQRAMAWRHVKTVHRYDERNPSSTLSSARAISVSFPSPIAPRDNCKVL
jgi:hypothetical protein